MSYRDADAKLALMRLVVGFELDHPEPGASSR